MAHQYALVIWYSEEDGTYLVEVPELPGCMADGKAEVQLAGSARRNKHRRLQ